MLQELPTNPFLKQRAGIGRVEKFNDRTQTSQAGHDFPFCLTGSQAVSQHTLRGIFAEWFLRQLTPEKLIRRYLKPTNGRVTKNVCWLL